jgi:hypothetical protein
METCIYLWLLWLQMLPWLLSIVFAADLSYFILQFTRCIHKKNKKHEVITFINYIEEFEVWYVQRGLILCDLFLRKFTLTWLKNLHHFSNWHNFWFKVLWHSWSVTALISCKRLTGCDTTVLPSFMCMDYVGDVIMQLI